MATTLTTALMNLILPIPLAELGPQWATDINTAFQVLDAHDHSAGKGAQITPAGMNINVALPFGGNSATGLRTVQFNAQSSNPSLAGDVRCFYSDASGNAWWNNGAGTQVQITAGGTLNSGALVANIYAEQSVTTNFTINSAQTYVSLLINTTAARTITLPAANSVATGRFYLLKDISGQANANPITVAPTGADNIDGANASIALKSKYGAWGIESDGVSNWYLRRLGGDVGTIASPTAAPAAGNLLYASSATQLAYGPLNLAGGANYVTGVLPAANLGAATTTQSGAVQLAGDLGGTATSPIVLGVTGSFGSPFVLASASPPSIQLGGTGGSAAVFWPRGVANPSLGVQALNTALTPTRLKFYGQDHDPGSTGPGGGIDYVSGASHGASGGDSNTNGDHKFSVGGNVALHLAEVVTGRSVVALGNSVSSSDVSSGNRFVWIGNANVAPTTSSTTGAQLFSQANNFTIWPASGTPFSFQSLSTLASAPASGAVIYTNSTNASIGFVRSGGAPLEFCNITDNSAVGSGGGPALPASVTSMLVVYLNGVRYRIPMFV